MLCSVYSGVTPTRVLLSSVFTNLTVSLSFEPHRRHTRYYGGYHSNHRVVNWLWDVLEKEFSEEEKSRFLKVPYAILICPIL